MNVKNNSVDSTYLDLVRDVLDNGVLKPTRAKIDGKNVAAKSVFGRQARFSFCDGFPILTSKRVSLSNILYELIWFLRGDSNIKYLNNNGVHIWDSWASPNGELGFGTYGTLWRKFPFDDYVDKFEKYHGTLSDKNYYGPTTDGSLNYWVERDEYGDPRRVTGYVDQIKQLLSNIEEVKKDPTASCGRRLMVTAWHPYYTDKVGLPPCHCLFQFNVTNDRLSCQLYQRSCDLFLGVPYNITSYCLLTYIIAHLTGLKPGEFIHTYGDLHIYENHFEQMKEQLSRPTYKLPQLKISQDFTNVDNINIEHFSLNNYIHSGPLRGEVAV